MHGVGHAVVWEVRCTGQRYEGSSSKASMVSQAPASLSHPLAVLFMSRVLCRNPVCDHTAAIRRVGADLYPASREKDGQTG